MSEEGLNQAAPTRRMPPRTRSNFLTRTATDDAFQLDRRLSSMGPATEEAASFQHSGALKSPYEPIKDASEPPTRRQSLKRQVVGGLDGSNDPLGLQRRSSSSGKRRPDHFGQLPHNHLGEDSLTAHMQSHGKQQAKEGLVKPPRSGQPRPVGGDAKLGTFSGVFVPTTLNVLSIIMFLRFGFILGQAGFLGMMGMLIVSYVINLVTTLSISAIATNGTVRGGGAYYLISRSLGPEFGGSIGVVFYLGFVFNTGMNAVGLIDCFKQNFGTSHGNWARWLPEGFWYQYLWASIILLICTAICLAGSGIFARCSNGLLALLLIATFSIPVSSLFQGSYADRSLGIEFTGLSSKTFMGNLLPKLTKGADGSQIRGRENFQDLFGILFPATGGIFAGASMSGDLKHPSKAIPKGTLSGLALTFCTYIVVILAMASSITRGSFYDDVNIIQDTNLSGVLILLGEFSTCFFSSLMGVIGSAKLLQALARDNLIPGLSVFSQGTKGKDEPTYAILFTHVVAQLTMLCDLNQIASFVTMTYLMTFLVTNLACFLLKIASAPNFRPSFHFFNWYTALFGTLISGASMFFVDGLYATGCVGILVIIFLVIHYTSPPKSWGDVSQSLIYHQVRKYLLRLRQEHVKFWRPQILLFVNDPRSQYKLIQFCNSLKKGALFVLGHVIVANEFGTAVPEARRQQAAWTKYIDFSKVKAFVNIAISPAVEWGTRNIVLSAGLGGMRPNIVVMGFYNLGEFRKAKPLIDLDPLPHQDRASEAKLFKASQGRHRRDSKAEKLQGLLPTDACRTETPIGPTTYVTILEDLLLRLQINVAIAKGFSALEFPHANEDNAKKYIDLWPIQMSAEIAAEGGEEKQNVLTTNFDTYTLILQLGCILNTVPNWKRAYKLRVAVFVEYESDVEDERGRVKTLLNNLRIESEVLVFWLASGEFKMYQVIVNGDISNAGLTAEQEVNEVLESEEWWGDVQKLRGRRGEISATEELSDLDRVLHVAPTLASLAPSVHTESESRNNRFGKFADLKRLIQRSKRRQSSLGTISNLKMRLGMRTHKLHDDLLHRHASHGSASEDSDSDTDGSSVFMSTPEDDASSQDQASVASANDVDEFEDTANEPRGAITAPVPKRSHSEGDDRSRAAAKKTRKSPNIHSAFSKRTQAASTRTSTNAKEVPSTSGHSPATESEDGERIAPNRPRPKRHSSAGKLTSNLVPETTVNTDDGPGPSIMFTENENDPQGTRQGQQKSIYNRKSSNPNPPSPSQTASGFPANQSIPLSFNDLPCRAQHLILNELMQKQSADTAVLFTTLPSPVDGTCNSEEDSARYLSDLEVLCQGLPPVLLVHSNSMTVTMNL